MTGHPAFVHPLAARLGVVNCVHQAKQFDLGGHLKKRVGPRFVPIDQIRGPGKYDDIAPRLGCDKNKELSGMAPTDLIAHWQSANHVANPYHAANDNSSLATASALENQPRGPNHKRYPPVTDAQPKAEEPAPPRLQYGMHRSG